MKGSSPDNDSPYHMFGEDSPTWLHRRAKNNELILPGDVARIIEVNPDLVPDDFIRDFVIRGLTGQLKQRSGRKPYSSRAGRNYYAVTMYNDLYPRAVARQERARLQGRKKGATDHAPAELVQALIGRHLGRFFGKAMSWEAVRNLLSSLRKPPN